MVCGMDGCRRRSHVAPPTGDTGEGDEMVKVKRSSSVGGPSSDERSMFLLALEIRRAGEKMCRGRQPLCFIICAAELLFLL